MYATVSTEPKITPASTARSTAVPCSSASTAASFATNPAIGGRPAIEAAASPATTARAGALRPTPLSSRRSRVPVE